MPSYRNLIVAVQVISVGVTLIILSTGQSLGLAEKQVIEWGGTLSTALIMLGLICHVQVKRGTPLPGLLALLGCFGPIYAYLGGQGRYLLGFHVVALGFHAIILKALSDKAKAADNVEQ